ncbi:hypothetical protein TRFO_17565 [Tritrichomonas foetus]|uniref:Guanylate cyclase domain-containing protein n=1 Tax=Tritrichomonas foetus TaxID=1144522 RepID=A0A1J4KSS3_9EUKA|nr:hypothetical protein TRFO_17565 [Tritrichomonas foetus]|eukprot:OHT12525.1 hypothetical protein TRFO_17565 [Tritrichomonas foetus]
MNNEKFVSVEDDDLGYDRHTIFFSFFSLVYEINKLHIWNPYYYFFQWIFMFIQILSVMYWPLFSNYESDSSIFNDIVGNLNAFVTFSKHDQILNHTPVQLAVIIVINILIISWILFAILYTRNHNRVSKAMVLATAFVLQILTHIFFLPTVSVFATSIPKLVDGELVEILIFIALLILLVLSAVIIHASMISFPYLVSPNRCLFASFDGLTLEVVLYITSYQILFSYISLYFASWAKSFIVSFHTIASFFIIFYMFQFPYVYLPANVIMASYGMAYVVSDILSILYLCNVQYSEYIRVFVPIAVGFISCLVFFIIFRRIRIKGAQITNNPALYTDECDGYLQSLNIKSAFEAMRLIRIGFSMSSRSIFNGTFPLYFANKFDDVNLWFLACSIFSFFPGEQENFQEALQKLKVKSPSHTLKRIRLMGLMRLDQYRNFVATLEFDRTFLRLQEVTHDSISCIKQFWSNTAELNSKVSISTLCNVASHVRSASDTWSEILMIHPTEQSFIELYSVFQIECLGKIEKGIRTQIRSEKAQKVQNHEVDPLFRVLVITKPELLKNGIVSSTGHLIDCEETVKATELSYHDEVIEGYNEIQERQEDQFDWAFHRIQLGRATFHFKPNFLSLFRFLSVFAVLIWLGILMVGFYFSVVTFSRYDNAFDRSINFVTIQNSFNFAHVSLLLQWAFKDNLSFSNETYSSTLTPEIIQSEKLNIDPFNLGDSIDELTNSAQKSMIEILMGLSTNSLMQSEFNIVVNSLIEPAMDMYYCTYDETTDKMILSYRNASVKAGMLVIAWYQQYFDTQEMGKTNPITCELNILYRNYPKASQKAIYKLDAALDQRLEEDIRIFNIYVIIFCITSILLWLPLIFTPTFLIRIEINKTIKAIMSISNEGALQASKFLSKNENVSIFGERITETANEHRNNFITSVTISQFLPYLLVALVLILGALPHYYVLSTIKQDVDYQKKEHLGALRLPMCSGLLSIGMLYSMVQKLQIDYMNLSVLQNDFSILIENITNTNNRYIREVANKYEDLRQIHFIDQCESVESATRKHSFYSCLAIERAVNTYLVMTRDFFLDNFTFDSREFVDIFHFSTTELFNKLRQSIEVDKEIQYGLTGNGQIASICMFSIAIVLLILAFGLILYFDSILLHILKTAMLLIRHVPPPVIAENQQMIDLLIKQKKTAVKKLSTVSAIIYEHTSTPIICVGDGFIIEAVNSTFASVFGLDHKMLVGHPLSFVIPRPDSGAVDLSIEEQGAYHLFEKMEMMQANPTIDVASYSTFCICNDEYVPAKSTAYPVRESNGEISNYVLFIEDRRKFIEEAKKLEDAKKTCDALMNQLVPRDIANFTAGKNDFAFVSKKATIVAVQITMILEIMSRKLSDFDNIISDIEAIARKNPPFFMMKTVFDTIYLVGGLFQDGDISLQATSALVLAKALKTKMEKIILQSEEKRFAIAIVMGGPILSGLVGTENPLFEVSGAIIDEAAELSSMCPKDEIIISEEFRQVLVEILPNEDFNRYGPMVFGRPTYLL